MLIESEWEDAKFVRSDTGVFLVRSLLELKGGGVLNSKDSPSQSHLAAFQEIDEIIKSKGGFWGSTDIYGMLRPSDQANIACPSLEIWSKDSLPQYKVRLYRHYPHDLSQERKPFNPDDPYHICLTINEVSKDPVVTTTLAINKTNEDVSKTSNSCKVSYRGRSTITEGTLGIGILACDEQFLDTFKKIAFNIKEILEDPQAGENQKLLYIATRPLALGKDLVRRSNIFHASTSEVAARIP